MPLLLAQHDDIATSDRQSATGRRPHLFRISRVGCSYRLLMISRIDHSRGRPVLAGGGMNRERISHSASDRSLP
jgi:hypothetical protein